MRLAPTVLLPVLALSALAACGGDDDPRDDRDPTASAATTSEESPPTSSPSPPGTSSPGGASPGQVPRPAPDSCQPVAESPDGVYRVADAGQVTLRMQDGVLSLQVNSSAGWTVSSNTTGDEADIEFSRAGEELDFEADLENGRLVLQICSDDD
jgi:hypothetical protein